jgi:hypothetical protein
MFKLKEPGLLGFMGDMRIAYKFRAAENPKAKGILGDVRQHGKILLKLVLNH